jgi:hypothetical protein
MNLIEFFLLDFTHLFDLVALIFFLFGFKEN